MLLRGGILTRRGPDRPPNRRTVVERGDEGFVTAAMGSRPVDEQTLTHAI